MFATWEVFKSDDIDEGCRRNCLCCVDEEVAIVWAL